MGVTIFFVLSGFLITYLLLIESKKAKIDIKKFYIRRILRIWPIYYLYLLVCLILIYFLTQEIETKKIVFYVFFAANIPFIYEFTLRFLDHFWSNGYGAWSTGNITDKMVNEYLEHHRKDESENSNFILE